MVSNSSREVTLLKNVFTLIWIVENVKQSTLWKLHTLKNYGRALKNIEFTMWPKVSIYPEGLCYTILKKLSDLAT